MTATIKTYTLADLTQTKSPWVNSWGVKLYDQNGLEVALQGNFDGQRQRFEGSSPVHHHHHDELVYLLEGDYGRHNRDKVDALEFNFLRIRAGVEHGGDANGVWISAKPKDFRPSSLDSSQRTIGYNGSQLAFRLNYLQIDPELITPGLAGVEIIAEYNPRTLIIKASNSSSIRALMIFEFSG